MWVCMLPRLLLKEGIRSPAHRSAGDQPRRRAGGEPPCHVVRHAVLQGVLGHFVCAKIGRRVGHAVKDRYLHTMGRSGHMQLIPVNPQHHSMAGRRPAGLPLEPSPCLPHRRVWRRGGTLDGWWGTTVVLGAEQAKASCISRRLAHHAPGCPSRGTASPPSGRRAEARGRGPVPCRLANSPAPAPALATARHALNTRSVEGSRSMQLARHGRCSRLLVYAAVVTSFGTNHYCPHLVQDGQASQGGRARLC